MIINHENQRQLLKRILNYTISQVPFYKNFSNLDDNNLTSFPLISKDEIRNNYAAFISDDFRSFKDSLIASLTEVRPIGPAIYERVDENGILIGQTGGSSGVPFRIPKSIDDRMRMGIGIWHQRQSIDSTVNPSRMYRFVHTGISNPKFDAWKLDKDNILNLYSDVRSSNCTWLHSYAPLLIKHMKFCQDNDINIKLPQTKYFECSGYYVDSDTVKIIENFFDAKLINQYGMMETWTISLTCIHGHHHINEENVHVEIVDDFGRSMSPGQPGRIVVTSLNARLLPFVRYVTNDYGFYKEKTCSCALGSKTIEILKFRECEMILGYNRKISGKDLFRRALKKALISTGHDELTYFRVIQKKVDHFCLFTNKIRDSFILIEKIRSTVSEELESEITIEYIEIEGDKSNSDERKPWVFRREMT